MSSVDPSYLPRPDSSTWRHSQATITAPSKNIDVPNSQPYTFRLHYVDVPAFNKKAATADVAPRGTILLIHGFPQTWYQWRHTINPLSNAGYRVIVPDYRGAGNSQAPPSNAGFAGGKGGGYTKVVMADDLRQLVKDHLGIKEKIHVVGHDIGAMVGHAYASFFAEDTKSFIWVDCPLPGTKNYWDCKAASTDTWHFIFHNVQDDLPERLVSGHERIYMRHFFDRLCVNPYAIVPGGEDEDVYVTAYTRPGAMRAAFDAYRTFDEDARENSELVKKVGKCKVPCLSLPGGGSFNYARSEEQLNEFYEDVEKSFVPNSGHYVPDEEPEAFSEIALAFINKHSKQSGRSQPE